MALAQTIRDAVDAAFVALDDIPLSIVYTKVALGAYDVAADSQARTETDVTVQGVMYNGKDIEQDAVRRLTSAQSKNSVTDETFVLIPASDLPAYTPTLNDYITVDGEKWEIWAMVPVPTNPCWILKVRKSG